jgi:hypothetical protein
LRKEEVVCAEWEKNRRTFRALLKRNNCGTVQRTRAQSHVNHMSRLLNRTPLADNAQNAFPNVDTRRKR